MLNLSARSAALCFMRIEELLLRKVGPFEDTRIPFPKGTRPNRADVYLLTGPNGSGKSTALYAIAGLIGCGESRVGRDLAAVRFWGPGSLSAIRLASGSRASAWATEGQTARSELRDPFSDGEMFLRSRHEFIGYFGSKSEIEVQQYLNAVLSLGIGTPPELKPRISWAAFAYAGMRSVNDARLTAIQEPQESPFENSLSFLYTADTQRLAQWIANQDFKRLKAKEAGNAERAEQLRRSIRDIEEVVTEILGEPFAFVTSDSDNNVRVRRNGSVLDLGLLPDGLKSIVSWIADLLMRLDRIPWVDDTPPLKRSFLLLLDEIDVHLHPSWQRKVLPIVQRMFPNAQIIASTHSPFVVSSAEDAHVITLAVEHGTSRLESVQPSQIGVSYSSVLRQIFGIDTEFDVETEREFARFHEEKRKLLSGANLDRASVQRIRENLARRSEEVRELVAVELRQLDRQLQNATK